MRAGTLDRRVTIRRRVQMGADSLNAPIFELQNVRTVWAAKTAKSESERFNEETKQRYASDVVTFKTYFMADIQRTDVLECEGVAYDISGIREIGRREGLEITAEAQA